MPGLINVVTADLATEKGVSPGAPCPKGRGSPREAAHPEQSAVCSGLARLAELGPQTDDKRAWDGRKQGDAEAAETDWGSVPSREAIRTDASSSDVVFPAPTPPFR